MTYAEEIDQRIIHGTQTTISFTRGRLTFQHIYANNPHRRIGSGVRFKGRGTPINWVFKTFVDGTAIFYPNKLYNFTYPVSTSITDTVYKYYKRIKNVEAERGGDFQVLQYKLLPEAAEHILQSDSFGEFLAHKYNNKGELQ